MGALTYELPTFGRDLHARRGVRGNLLLQPLEDPHAPAVLSLRPSDLWPLRAARFGRAALPGMRRGSPQVGAPDHEREDLGGAGNVRDPRLEPARLRDPDGDSDRGRGRRVAGALRGIPPADG